MLKLTNIVIEKSKEFKVADGAVINAEGICLVQDMENGQEVCKPSDGSTNGIFLGVSYGYTFTPLTKSNVETFVVSTTGSPVNYTLSKTPISGQISVYNVTTESAINSGDPTTATNVYAISGNTLTVNLSDPATIVVTYRYEPTAMELYMNGEVIPNSMSPTDVIGSIGVIQRGEIYTDMFDASSNWYDTSTPVKAGANGLFTKGTGIEINAVVTSVPTSENPYLGIRFSDV